MCLRLSVGDKKVYVLKSMLIFVVAGGENFDILLATGVVKQELTLCDVLS